MGRLDQQETILNHFSHIHPLQLIDLHQQHVPQLNCNLCNQICTNDGTDAFVYRCAPCNHTLHRACADIPPTLHHPSHPSHPLSLLTSPAYPTGSFSCDACGAQGARTDPSFHCPTCEVDLHVPCALMPYHAHHRAHPHPLVLTFMNPYGGSPFTCDICGGIGGPRHWWYRCGSCGFDAHMECATAKAAVEQQQQQLQQQQMLLQQQQQLVRVNSQSTGKNPLVKQSLSAGKDIMSGIIKLYLVQDELQNQLVKKVFKGCKKTTQSQPVPAMALNMAQPTSINSGWPCMVQQSSGPMHYNINGATSQSQPVLSMGLNAPPPASMNGGGWPNMVQQSSSSMQFDNRIQNNGAMAGGNIFAPPHHMGGMNMAGGTDGYSSSGMGSPSVEYQSYGSAKYAS